MGSLSLIKLGKLYHNFPFSPVFGSCNSKMLLVKSWNYMDPFCKIWFAFIKVTREFLSSHFFSSEMFSPNAVRDFFVTIALTSKLWNLMNFTIEKLFHFMFLSNWFVWNVKYKIFLLINYLYEKKYFIFQVQYTE